MWVIKTDLLCDGCEAYIEGDKAPADTKYAVADKARMYGWTLGVLHFCRDCQDKPPCET